jgi:SpoVK/Ycf46/Vps4 family AAA+-type ATPase
MNDQSEDIRHKVTKFIAACVVHTKPNLNWGHVIGCEHAKKELYQNVVLPHKLISESVQRFDDRYPTPGDVLIEGKSGSGRTKLVHTVASMCKADFFCVVNCVDIITNFGIESSLFLRILFESAEKYKRSIIFLRNLDCFEEDCNWIILPTKAELKHQMEFWKQRWKFFNGELKSVTVIGTTRNMRLLDIGVVIRFKSRTLVELPVAKERFQMFQMFFGDACLALKERDWKIVVDNTEGYIQD